MGLMTRTINRQPWTVRSIDYDDTGYKYFGYSDWKGKCTNKNFIGVDQETFEDCSNVYVDRDSVLRSRPALKKNAELSKGNTLKLYTFGPWRVYKLGNPAWSACKIVFTNDVLTLETSSDVPVDCKVVLADEKIFVFADNYAKYVDTAVTPLAYKDATDLVYSPVTKVFTTSGEQVGESPNLWGKTHRERYIWNRKAPVDLTNLVSKKVTVQIGENGEQEVIDEFTKYQEYTIAKKLYTGLDTSYLYYPIKTVGSDGTITRVANKEALVMMDVSNRNSIIRAKNVPKTVSGVSYRYYEVEYSVDGVTFNKLGEMPWDSNKPYNCYNIPRFSEDGTIVYVYTSAGLYAVSVLSDSTDGSYRYTDWTNLCTEYSISSNIVFTEYGNAYVNTYNNFSVFTGIASTTDTAYALFMVQEGTLVSKAGYLTTDNIAVLGQRHTQLLSNTANTIVCTTDVVDGNSSIVSQYVFMIHSTTGNSPSYNYLTYARGTSVDARYAALTKVAMYNGIYMYAAVANEDHVRLFGYVTSGVTPTWSDEKIFVTAEGPIKAESASSILMADDYVYDKTEIVLDSTYAIAVKNYYLYYGLYNSTTQTIDVYTTYFADNVWFTETVQDRANIDYRFDSEAELSQYYISKGKSVYITSKGAYTNNDFDWYFPEEYKKDFDYEVTGLHPISTTEVAVFTQDSIYYIVPTTVTINEQEQVAYNYYKSRIPLGCNKGSDIVTSYDGKYTIFSTKRGLVAMAYQDFVNSTEQALTFLSDNISQAYFDWNQGAIKLALYKYWLIVYRLDTEYSFVYDMRNASWWPMQYGIVQQVIEVNQKLVVLSRHIVYTPDTGDDNYKDDYYGNIKWSLLSQKLHFNAINYYKAVNNITLSSVMTSLPDPGNPFTCNMRVTTYRKIMDGTQLPETMSFYVDMIRTFVKKLNYIKLGQFQYELLSDDVNAQQKPLSLTSIVIKYKTTGQVR